MPAVHLEFGDWRTRGKRRSSARRKNLKSQGPDGTVVADAGMVYLRASEARTAGVHLDQVLPERITRDALIVIAVQLQERAHGASAFVGSECTLSHAARAVRNWAKWPFTFWTDTAANSATTVTSLSAYGAGWKATGGIATHERAARYATFAAWQR